mmetsp:Transcript_23202/g.64308  ORF Transcript_23202/g.64308 Transcript_23202/m.64308 type:complete len:1152 (-) Transcript_23202:1762-5217(-)
MKERNLARVTELLVRQRVFSSRHFGISNPMREFSHLAASASGGGIQQRVERQKQQQRQGVFDDIHLQQLRYRRHDRASAFSKPRPPTKKKRREYNRRMKRIADEKARHSAPGSKAGPRRQWARNRWEQLLVHGKNDNGLLPSVQEEEEYTYEDAILEDLMANTSYLTSQPTPEPVYLGHRHREFYNRVADQMDAYREAIDKQKSDNESDDTDRDVLPVSTEVVSLPSDSDISKTLRAYRDRHGTRQKPIGIILALQHLLQDLGVPVSAFGEHTFTTLMTCCQTPQEGRRIFKLMRDQNHEVSSYSWSILVDIHAKLGDFEGCGEVLKEMASHGGHAPTQAAYTSLLAACYKICSDSGRIPHAVRAKAGDFGWKHWQEMRIVGIEPDVMAYGAILRLCAARGLPERAIGLLEDMERFEVKPTTLCFTAALKSVAKSHEIANRYQRGTSRRDMKRETITAHHGKMARQIIILAEAAEVEQDDGFTSALMLCAGAAGDSATAKAILLASEVRKVDHLRTIGGSRPNQLDGGDGNLQLDSGTNKDGGKFSDLIVMEGALDTSSRNKKEIATFGEREYGKDTRVISALIHSCAKALNKNGLGTMWAGRENLGYLCENSLRLITTRWEPSYRDRSVPGVSSTKVGIGALRHMDEREKDYEYTPGKRKKFRGLFVDEDDIATSDDLRGGDDDEGDEIDFDDEDLFSDDSDEDLFFGEEKATTNAPQYRLRDPKSNGEEMPTKKEFSPQDNDSKVYDEVLSKQGNKADEKGEAIGLNEEAASELFGIDQNDFSGHGEEDKLVPTPESYEEALDQALAELKEHASQSDEKMDLSENQIQELFDRMQKDLANDFEGESELESSLFEEQKSSVDTNEVNDLIRADDGISLIGDESIRLPDKPSIASKKALAGLDSGQLSKIEDLQSILPGMPLRRVRKILDKYEQTLGHPSMLSLIPIVRETMPDYLSPGWLKRSNKRNADFALQKAAEDDIVDSSLLNSMLEVKTYSGSLNEALEYHEKQFAKYKISPSPYSDRLLLQMLVANKRLTRALELKEQIEEAGRNLDLASYGSLVQFYSRHQQLGSALLILKECIAKHSTAPSEAYISDLRLLCKRKDVEDVVDLIGMIGKDPKEWLRHGEKHLKREKSKKGRRNVQHAQNRLL